MATPPSNPSSGPYSTATLPPSPVTVLAEPPKPSTSPMPSTMTVITKPSTRKLKLRNKPRMVVERENGHEWLSPSKKLPFVSCKLCGLVRRLDGTSSPCKGEGKLRLWQMEEMVQPVNPAP